MEFVLDRIGFSGPVGCVPRVYKYRPLELRPAAMQSDYKHSRYDCVGGDDDAVTAGLKPLWMATRA